MTGRSGSEDNDRQAQSGRRSSEERNAEKIVAALFKRIEAELAAGGPDPGPLAKDLGPLRRADAGFVRPAPIKDLSRNAPFDLAQFEAGRIPTVTREDAKVTLERVLDVDAKIGRYRSALEILGALRKNGDLEGWSADHAEQIEGHIRSLMRPLLIEVVAAAGLNFDWLPNVAKLADELEKAETPIRELPPVWQPEKTGLSASQHWEKHYEPFSIKERPTLGEVQQTDPRFLAAVRAFANHRGIEMNQLLRAEPGRKRGRKATTGEDALAALEKRRERDRERKRASKPKKPNRKSKRTAQPR